MTGWLFFGGSEDKADNPGEAGTKTDIELTDS